MRPAVVRESLPDPGGGNPTGSRRASASLQDCWGLRWARLLSGYRAVPGSLLPALPSHHLFLSDRALQPLIVRKINWCPTEHAAFSHAGRANSELVGGKVSHRTDYGLSEIRWPSLGGPPWVARGLRGHGTPGYGSHCSHRIPPAHELAKSGIETLKEHGVTLHAFKVHMMAPDTQALKRRI